MSIIGWISHVIIEKFRKGGTVAFDDNEIKARTDEMAMSMTVRRPRLDSFYIANHALYGLVLYLYRADRAPKLLERMPTYGRC